ncbi:hypothetical protein M409DRAFT_54696 [Zasmidium cellare ATCC 36951]|uniref:Alpha/beta hydrolase fold-3 domain-containing protein n=1 Tax=Zasmidium cellare ATCC 36951 TaxID=1080233 RepID=A0A6A6CI88_ZASCE|nr:uncharacterized protein M409DRAFT_54696 [Zasmidium cellare ATCC 36951]KAF2166934.1 hypothetical protein M409DRAFT_54696 [Zasmidium cellare ATCC 36951]
MDILLNIRVAILRFLFNYNEGLERKQEPQPPAPTFIETIPSSSPQGSVALHFYTPPGFQKRHGQVSKTRYPLVIDFHGGGFTAGRPSINARWIASLLASDAQPVVVGVDYGLAPGNPFPGPIQDAVVAILWLANEGAEKYSLDPKRIVLTGFSAGGTLSIVAPMWIQDNPEGSSSGRKLPYPLRGIVSVYPGIDFRMPRKPPADMLGRFLSGTWDQAFYQRSPLDSPFVSPAAATDEQLKNALPQRVGLYPVENDDLMKPCEDLRERLKRLGKQVTGDIEPDAFHGWDKYPAKEGDAAKWEKREAWFARMARDIEAMLR